MTSTQKPRIGRPSKGKRHAFTVKLDMARAVKMAELLKILGTNGIEHLTPIVEAHVDSIDLDELRSRQKLSDPNSG